MEKYTISEKKTKDIANIDLFPNKLYNGYITLNSLSTLGIKCVEVPIKRLYTFSPFECKI